MWRGWELRFILYIWCRTNIYEAVEPCSTKLHNWSFHRTFYLKKIVLSRSFKLCPACVVYSPVSSFLSGYSLSSGKFLSARSTHIYVAGSPRNDGSRGKVSNLKNIYTAPRRGYTSTILLHNLLYMINIPPFSPIFLYLIDDDMAYFEGKYKVTFYTWNWEILLPKKKKNRDKTAAPYYVDSSASEIF